MKKAQAMEETQEMSFTPGQEVGKGEVPVENGATLSPVVLTGMDPLMKLAATPGANIDAIKDLVQLYREERAYQAEREFNDAFAGFQGDCPAIKHDAEADFATNSGGRMRYTYATLPAIAKHVTPYLHARGFSYSWESKVESNILTTTCTLRHKGGHHRSATFACPFAPGPGQSAAQGMKAAQTFSQRCSLISVAGLSTTDTDNDGAGNGAAADFITEQQALDLDALVAETGSNKQTLLRVFGINSFSEVHVGGQLDTITRMLMEKRKKS